jgi:hypothetical protein
MLRKEIIYNSKNEVPKIIAQLTKGLLVLASDCGLWFKKLKSKQTGACFKSRLLQSKPPYTTICKLHPTSFTSFKNNPQSIASLILRIQS